MQTYPTAQPPTMEPGEMGEQIAAELELTELPAVNTKAPEEIAARIRDYFQWCINHDARPHVEQMALALHTTRQTLWNWRRSGGARGEVIEQAIQVLASLHESWGLTGKLNPATFCFVAKNNFGWRDTVEIEAVQHDSIGTANMTPEQIAARIEEDIPDD